MQTMLNARHEQLSADDYHAHPAIGASMLEDFRKSRRVYYGRHVAREIVAPEPSEAMTLGTLLHLRLLEPARFVGCVDVFPETASDGLEWNWRKPSHREERDKLQSGYDGVSRWLVQRDTLAEIEAIAEGVESNQTARAILRQPGEPEYSIFWTDEETGLECKCRVDWFAETPLDIKTTRDPAPESYAKQVVGLGYHRKLAHYKAGLRALLGKKVDLVHLAIGTVKPYTVGQYNLLDFDRDGHSLGAGQRRMLLHKLKCCIDSGDWREPWEKGVVDLEIPNWAHGEDVWQL